ncbi:hypothetical protein [Selenomonas ruminantium]|uniref:hypothetical protein n=1 Tax=Selenomonas ruminantium TaxID=971 RepID=UPI0012FF39CF|nr:hypothetical protein [Selenomonas ruminantium]
MAAEAWRAIISSIKTKKTLCIEWYIRVGCAAGHLFSTQNFDNVQPRRLFFGLFLVRKLLEFVFLSKPVGIGSSLLNSLLAFRAIHTGVYELSAFAAGITDFAAHGKLAVLNHSGSNSQWSTGIFYDIAGTAIGICFNIFFYFQFIVPKGIIAFLTGA